MGFGIELVMLAGLFVAGSNFCMRKSVDNGGNTRAFLMIQMAIVFLIAILLNPVRSNDYSWSTPMVVFGLIGGLLLAVMMITLGKAVECGPPGLTFAILNSSTVMPTLVMVAIFGSQFGYIYTFFNGLGSLLVVCGLFWAGWQVLKGGDKSRWGMLIGTAFLCHVIFLCFMQWRALFINFPGEDGLYLSFSVEDAKSQWFMPMVFLSCAAVQFIIYYTKEKRYPKFKEILWGFLGGVTNGIGTFFLIRSTEVATSVEHAMLFPLFSVVIIVITNTWGQLLYKEKVNWLANGLCILGIVVGTMDWKMLFSN